MPRILRTALVAALGVALLATVAGCQPKPAAQPQRSPKVQPPAIGQPGVLRAGVDLQSPPFASTNGQSSAGIDVDVASALAERLGLGVQFVNVRPDQASAALKAGTVDVALSVPLDENALQGATMAGTYLDDGPVFFSRAASGSADSSVTPDTVDGKTVGAQNGSLAFWTLSDTLGEGSLRQYATLRSAFEAAANGQIDLVAGDAVTGSYIARDFPGFRIVGQAGPSTRLGVAVAPENTTLAEKVRAGLDALAADGVLATIRAKWVGDMPNLGLTEPSS